MATRSEIRTQSWWNENQARVVGVTKTPGLGLLPKGVRLRSGLAFAPATFSGETMSLFTDEHYKAIARVIFNIHKSVKNMDLYHEPSLLLEAGERIRSGLSKMFAEDNPDFNPEQFYKACEEHAP